MVIMLNFKHKIIDKSDYMYEQILKLYHCNFSVNIAKAISSKDYLILKARDDRYWIGNGVYFWDNLSNAKYWKQDKERKMSLKNSNNIKFSICVGMVCLDKLFDLSDSDVRKKLEDYFENYYKTNPRLINKGFGEKINFLLKEKPEIIDKFYVIKAHGNYPRESTKLYHFHRNKVGLTPKVKTIYNVINTKAILKLDEEVS